MKLEGKTAIVTGGGQGIGRAIVLTLAREGADVAIADMNIDTAKSVAEEVRAIGRKALAVKTDVTRSQEVNQMVKTVLGEMGKVDILVNNAGGSAQERTTEFCVSTEDVWDFIIARNLKSQLLCTRAVINHMIERKYGRIVNIASQSAVMGGAWQVDYCAAKAGVIGFTKALAREVGKHNIYVNSVSPGTTRTPAVEKVSRAPSPVLEQYRSREIIKRLCEPQEIANMVLFLASDDASYITGHNYCVDGGTCV